MKRPWMIGKRYGNLMTEVVDADGEIVCYVPTHEWYKAHGQPAEYRMTKDGDARLRAVLEAGA